MRNIIKGKMSKEFESYWEILGIKIKIIEKM